MAVNSIARRKVRVGNKHKSAAVGKGPNTISAPTEAGAPTWINLPETKCMQVSCCDANDLSFLLEFTVKQPGYSIPYFDLDGNIIRDFVRVRLNSTPKSGGKYLQRINSGCHIYYPPNQPGGWANYQQADGAWLWITEGEAKATIATAFGFPCLSVPGVSAWTGAKRYGTALLPDLMHFLRPGMRVAIAFDGDVMQKAQARKQLVMLANALVDHGCIVKVVDLGK
jgi:hypothetical protein